MFEDFDRIAQEEFDAIPEKWKMKIANVAFLIADEPTEAELKEAGIERGTMLGYYHGIPATERGASYGIGGALPDTITLYRKPITLAAIEDGIDVRTVIRETLWHEIAHYFGFDEDMVERREDEGTNRYT